MGRGIAFAWLSVDWACLQIYLPSSFFSPPTANFSVHAAHVSLVVTNHGQTSRDFYFPIVYSNRQSLCRSVANNRTSGRHTRMALASENLVAQHHVDAPPLRSAYDVKKQQPVKSSKRRTPVRQRLAGQPDTVHSYNAHENGLPKTPAPQRPPRVLSAWTRLPVVRRTTIAHAAFPHLRPTLMSHGPPRARDDRPRLHQLPHPQVDHGELPPLQEVRHVLDLVKLTSVC